jgi:hypothetical protein
MSNMNSPQVQLHDYSKGIELSTPIWRYLTLDAALTTITSLKLRFTRLGAFADEFEGSEDLESIQVHKEDAEAFSAQFDHPLIYRDPEVTRILNQQGGYASCWSLNPPTDLVMWRSYAQSLSSVALKSTIGKLMNSLVDVPGFSAIGIIKYKPMAGIPIANLHFQDKCFEKFDAYQFEHEVRLFISLLNEPRRPENLYNYPDHHFESVNRDCLGGLALHPLMPPETRSMVKTCLAKVAPDLDIEEPLVAAR